MERVSPCAEAAHVTSIALSVRLSAKPWFRLQVVFPIEPKRKCFHLTYWKQSFCT